MKKLLILILIIGLGVGGYFYLNQDNTPKKEVNKETKKVIALKDEDVKNSIFNKYYEEAIKVVDEMSTEEKVGQLFLVRYAYEDTEYLSNFNPGGYILFAKDFEDHTKESMRKELNKVNEKNKYPLILGVDEEGGFVTRVSRFKEFRSEKFKAPKDYYEEGGEILLKQTEEEKAKLLMNIGLNLNLAPVADVSTNENDFIYNRTFGRNAKETSELIKKMVKVANEINLNSCLKHFPGYGNNVDTHTGVAIDERSYESFKEKDFLPFEAGIKEGVPCVLIAHNVVKSMDSEYPASLSKKVIDELRNTLGFTGIVVTDDLAMEAVKAYVEDGKAATLAINAGNDMIITSDFVTMYKEVLKSVEDKDISIETINKAVIRIIAWKYSSGII
ncbi:MAG: beta-hexosaminidase [Bacilli bacterium]|nr:beta-hexosaminidase [Bacilli bacterium]